MKTGPSSFIIQIIIVIFLSILLPCLAVLGEGNRAYASAGLLYINEFMADNDNTIEDPDEPGAFDDWIEIYNSGDSIVDMSGMYLTDDPNDPTKWQIPDGVFISAGGYLLFWADNDEEQGNTHTNFRLSADGEEIGLFAADGTIIDSVTFDKQIIDISYGRYPDGSSAWDFMTGTPGTQNSPHNAPPQITGIKHTPNIPDEGEPVWVTCTVTEDGILADVILSYNAGSGPVDTPMHDDGAHNDGSIGDGLYGAQIPAFSKDTVVDYYVTATDNFGSQSLDPVTAPDITYSYVIGYVAPLLYINEFMADNDSVIADPNDPNSFEDWIELYNASENIIDLSGMYITDDLTNPTKWQIPSGITTPSGGYLLFWADNDDEEGSTHTNFNLNKDGEEIGLFDTDTRGNMLIDTVMFEEQILDISYGRENDGGEVWVFFEISTPGYTNRSINFHMELDAGWSMISLPVMSHNLKLSGLFPDAVVVYGFEKETGYIRVEEADDLVVGKGYWILLNDAQSYMLTGQLINEYTHPVYKNGWCMIGACTSSSQALVNNCSIEVIYSFANEFGYKRLLASDNLEPGRGYWILLSNTFGQAELTVGIVGSQ